MNFRIYLAAPLLLGLAACDFSSEDQQPEPAANQPSAVQTPARESDMTSGRGNEQAQRFARLALTCVNKQYPGKISHVLNGPDDVRSPQQLHPAFYGCYDWHSSVHGHWLLARLWGLGRLGGLDGDVQAALDRSLTAENIAAETKYFQGADRDSFERPYGMAWFLQLYAELEEIAQRGGPKGQQAAAWVAHLKPLEAVILNELKDWMPKLVYPIREGTHNETAFAFGLMLDYAQEHGDAGLAKMVSDKSREFYGDDEACPIGYEPSGEDFLSPCLMEADLMRRVLPRDDYRIWLTAFLPGIPSDGSSDWLKVGEVRDPTDGKLVHLDGLNLSRAWALRGIASALPEGDTRRAALLATADKHAEAGLKAVSGDNYSGGHWLASFATYLTTNRGIRDGAANAAEAGTITPVDKAPAASPSGKASMTPRPKGTAG
ncbi:DUF2891 domain-containing protein [Novosphingopyxis sp.]|uniref:DUF2891 domain-containing protein n=1 Tax=Novosphingopyxis sp. TaxID=2709690 RepID=UPI003B590675